MANENKNTRESQASATGSTPIVKTNEDGFTSTPSPGIQSVVNIPVPEKPKSKKVEVDADVLESILGEIKSLKQTVGELEQTGSQDQIRKIEALRASGKLVKSVKIRRFDGDLVLGWITTEDKVWVSSDGKLNEVQNLKVFTQAGEKETTLIQFTRGCLYEPYEVVSEARTDAGDVEFTVILKDGQRVVVNSKYVN